MDLGKYGGVDAVMGIIMAALSVLNTLVLRVPGFVKYAKSLGVAGQVILAVCHVLPSWGKNPLTANLEKELAEVKAKEAVK